MEAEARRNRRRIRKVSFCSDSTSASVASVLPIHTRSELSSDSDSAYDSGSVLSVASVASVNQPQGNILVLYRHGCFAGKYAAHKVHTTHKKIIWIVRVSIPEHPAHEAGALLFEASSPPVRERSTLKCSQKSTRTPHLFHPRTRR